MSIPRKALLDPDTGMLLPLDEQRAVLEVRCYSQRD